MNLIKIINRHWLVLAVSAVFGAILLLTASTHHKSDNDLSRLAGVVAVARHNRLNINGQVQQITGDRIEYLGKKYSSKPPVLHVSLGYLIKGLFQIKPMLLNNDVAIYRVSAVLSAVVPLLGIFLLFYLLMCKLSVNRVKSVVFALFLVSGTLLMAYARYLTNHILEALIQLLVFAFLLHPPRNLKRQYTIIGFLLSGLFVIDETYGFVAVPVTMVYLWWTNKNEFKKNLLYLILGAVPLSIFHFYLNYVQFETFLPPQLVPEKYLSYANSKWVGEGLTGMSSQRHPFLLRLFNYTFGTYGFFLYQPLMLIPLVVKKNYKNNLWIYVVALTFGYIFFNAIMQSDYGGSSFGPRRFLPLIPPVYYFVVKNLSGSWKKTFRNKLLISFSFFFTFIFTVMGYYNTWENWSFFVGTDKSKNLYFPLLYTLREVTGFFGFGSVL